VLCCFYICNCPVVLLFVGESQALASTIVYSSICISLLLVAGGLAFKADRCKVLWPSKMTGVR
jgi:hypothetical protein